MAMATIKEQDLFPLKIKTLVSPSICSNNSSNSSTLIQTISTINDHGNFNGNNVEKVNTSNKLAGLSPNPYAGEVKGPEGQICQNKSVLDMILTKYCHINSNTFKGGATGKIKAEYMICDCKYDHMNDAPHLACGTDSGCINRELSIECPPDNCPTGDFCQNRKFSSRHYAPIQIFDTQEKGYGLRTKMPLQKGAFVIEYCGEVLSTNIFRKRIIEYAKVGAKHFYFMSLTGGEYIDASKKGNISRFMNHSCSPNCELQKWIVGNQMRIGIFTTKCVPAGAELTFDYKFERYGNEAQPCYCGESNCTGFIGKEKTENSTMTIESDQELSEEEDDTPSSDQLKTVNMQVKALKSFEQVKDIVKYLMMYSGNPSKVLRALNKLLKTDTVALQRKFIHFRGLYLLERCLMENMTSKSIVKHNILMVLQKLPISTKNAIVKIESVVQQMTSAENFGFPTAELARNILESWASLELVYVIPKRSKGETSEDSSDLNKRTRSPTDSSSSQVSKVLRMEKVPSSERFQGLSGQSVNIPPPPPRGVVKTIHDPRIDLGWNKIHVPMEVEFDEIRQLSFEKPLAPTAIDAVSEKSIEAMIMAAQEANRIKCEILKKQQQEDADLQKRESKLKKKKLQERKERQRELAQSSKKAAETPKEAVVGEKREHRKGYGDARKDHRSAIKDAKSDHRSASGVSRSSSTKESSRSSSKDKSQKKAVSGNSLSDEQVNAVKKSFSNSVIKVMSRYKDQMDGEVFKDRAKAITKGLLEKEIRRHTEEGKQISSELNEKAVKKYVKEYLSRHNVIIA